MVFREEEEEEEEEDIQKVFSLALLLSKLLFLFIFNKYYRFLKIYLF
jgi:hypothetical protein